VGHFTHLGGDISYLPEASPVVRINNSRTFAIIARSPTHRYNNLMTLETAPYPRPQLDPDRMELGRAKARESRIFTVINLIVSLIYFLSWWGLIHTPLITWLEANITSFDLRVIVYVVFFGLGFTLVELPLDAYRHTRSVYYGLSVQSWRGWFIDMVKGLAIGGVFSLILVVILYRLLATFPTTWWLWMGLVYLLFTVVLTQLAPVLLTPLFYKVTPYEDDALAPRLKALAEEAGTQVGGVFRTNMSEKTTAANAWLSGLGRTRRIVLGDTLIDQYPPNEIVAIFAHEMGHQVHRDLGKGILLSSVVSLVGLWLSGGIVNWAVGMFGFSGPADLRAFPWLVLALVLFGVLTGPMLSTYSRTREWAADRYAYDHGPGPVAFADSLTRLANQNLADPAPPHWEVVLSYNHPPILDRIAAAVAQETGSR